ncbi:transposase [Gilvibacter sp. SZ-19]|jgi:REP element-mobilizing transposase RayT|uniref:REP-associated tyrosine transposase n=1 Tax=unclassified Gilvibacter TaxID=2625242 RepID=UPI000B3CB1B8|nr:transposase [Gilvibacter sp. SZ-19]ARV11916.1 transposase [Gilvibacter sp. SZ-19]
MSRKYKFHNPTAAYFVSFATVNWVDVFTRAVYFNVLAKSLSFCRANKGMEVYAFCFMPSHVHLIFRSKHGEHSSLLRDFKRFTSKQLLETIQSHSRESRKEWLLSMFSIAAKGNNDVWHFQFWQHHNHPIELWSNKVIKQKLDYIHNNPVKAGFVTKPSHWKWSSARNFSGKGSILEIDEIGFFGY